MAEIILLRKPKVLAILAIKKSTLHNRIKQGLITPPVPIGDRAVAWPSNEIESFVSAQIAGKSKEELRQLVKALLQKRVEEVAENG